METTILELTHRYVRAFDEKDIIELASLFADDALLIDPEVEAEGLDNVLAAIGDIYRTHERVVFSATNIYADQSQRFSVIEFILELNEFQLRGTDHLFWNQNNEIVKLEAFVYVKASA